MNSFVTFFSKILSLFMSVICAFNIATPGNHKTNDHKSTSSPKVYFEEFEEETPNNDIELVEDETPAPAEESKAPAAEEAKSEEAINENAASASGDINNSVADNGERNLGEALPVIDNDTNDYENLEVVDEIDVSEAQDNSVTMTLYANDDASFTTNTLNDVIIANTGYSRSNDSVPSVLAVIKGKGQMEDYIYRHFVDAYKYIDITRELLAEEYGLDSFEDVLYNFPGEITEDTDFFDVDNNTVYYTADGTELEVTDNVISKIDTSKLLKVSPTMAIFNGEFTTISDGAFLFCKDLTEVVLPSTVKSIGEDAFAYCTNLSTLQLNNGLERIGARAFLHCESLEEVTIPATVKFIGVEAFAFIAEGAHVICPNADMRSYVANHDIVTEGTVIR